MPATLRIVMDELVGLSNELAAAHPELAVYRYWRPDMQYPALWHWWRDAPISRPDMCTVRTELAIAVTIAVDPAATVDEDAYRLERYVDDAIAKLSPALDANRPLQATAASLNGFRMVSAQQGETPFLGVELDVRVTLDRNPDHTPTP